MLSHIIVKSSESRTVLWEGNFIVDAFITIFVVGLIAGMLFFTLAGVWYAFKMMWLQSKGRKG